MSGMLLTEYVPKIERLSVDLQERVRALGFGVNDVRHRYFIATANALSMYAVSWTLIHAAQQFGRGNFTSIVDGAPVRTDDEICPRIVDALFRNAYEAGGTLWNGYIGKLKAHLFHDAWGAFEDALRRVYGAVVSTAQQDEDAGLDAAGKRRHIDLPKMWKRLADITTANGSTKADRRRHFEVVVFLGAARNTTHTNTYYEGPERSLKVGTKTLRLVPDNPPDFLHIDTILELVGELASAFEFICKNVEHEAEITSPSSLRDPLQDWPAVKRP
jgi:hypothetical protein